MAKFGIEAVSRFARLREFMPSAGDLHYIFGICNDLSSRLERAGHAKRFYLVNDDVWERHLKDASTGSGPSAGLDSTHADNVDLFLIVTHGSNAGGITTLYFNSTNEGLSSSSDQWSLGDQSLRWLLVYGCKTIDRSAINQLLPVFKGLRSYCGAWGNMYDGWTVDDVGKDLANNLLEGDTTRHAWLDGVSDWWLDNHPITVCAETTDTRDGDDIDWSRTTLYNDRVPTAAAAPPGLLPHRTWLSYAWAEG